MKYLLVMGLILLATATSGPRPMSGLSAQASQQQVGQSEASTNQIIIKYKPLMSASALPAQAAQMAHLSAAAGVPMQFFRAMSGDANVLRLPAQLPLAQVQAISDRLMALPEVEYAEPDEILFPALTPNDSLYSNQWDLFGANGINAPAAWDITTGSSSIVVADIDTGITDHADLNGRTVPGYDFISDPVVANDGNARDPDPSDPGDWVSAQDINNNPITFNGCAIHNSTWHGTHTAGTIGAIGDNGLGVAGINWNSMILPVRVLGKCGGSTSDVIDGVRWAAGLPVTGVPNNTHPAKVLNLSLGGPGVCSTAWNQAILDVNSAGTVVVVAAGNNNADASNYTPASCTGVITVAATNQAGGRANYSNFGATVEISAPGGQQSSPNDPAGILSTLNTGTQGPVSDTYIYYQGTSMAAPHVTGVVSLMFSVNPSLTPLDILSKLQSTARAFPSGSTCNTSLCGSGMLDAGAAVSASLPPTTSMHTLMVTKTGLGSGTVTSVSPGIDCGPTCSVSLLDGTSIDLNAIASTGSTFTGWSGGGCSGTGTCTVTMDAAKSVTAPFTQNVYTLTTSVVGSGGINLNNPGPYHYNDVVQLTAVPATGWSFSAWSGDLGGSTNPTNITMDGDKSVTATFLYHIFLPEIMR
jgi:serine protease